MKRRDMISLLALLAVSMGCNASLQNNRSTFLSLSQLGFGSAVAAMPGDLTLPTPVPTPAKPESSATPDALMEHASQEPAPHLEKM